MSPEALMQQRMHCRGTLEWTKGRKIIRMSLWSLMPLLSDLLTWMLLMGYKIALCRLRINMLCIWMPGMAKLCLTSHHFLQDQVINGHIPTQTNLPFPRTKQFIDRSSESGMTMRQEDIWAEKKPFEKSPPIIIGQMLEHGSVHMSKDAQFVSRWRTSHTVPEYPSIRFQYLNNRDHLDKSRWTWLQVYLAARAMMQSSPLWTMGVHKQQCSFHATWLSRDLRLRKNTSNISILGLAFLIKSYPTGIPVLCLISAED